MATATTTLFSFTLNPAPFSHLVSRPQAEPIRKRIQEGFAELIQECNKLEEHPTVQQHAMFEPTFQRILNRISSLLDDKEVSAQDIDALGENYDVLARLGRSPSPVVQEATIGTLKRVIRKGTAESLMKLLPHILEHASNSIGNPATSTEFLIGNVYLVNHVLVPQVVRFSELGDTSSSSSSSSSKDDHDGTRLPVQNVVDTVSMGILTIQAALSKMTSLDGMLSNADLTEELLFAARDIIKVVIPLLHNLTAKPDLMANLQALVNDLTTIGVSALQINSRGVQYGAQTLFEEMLYAVASGSDHQAMISGVVSARRRDILAALARTVTWEIPQHVALLAIGTTVVNSQEQLGEVGQANAATLLYRLRASDPISFASDLSNILTGFVPESVASTAQIKTLVSSLSAAGNVTMFCFDLSIFSSKCRTAATHGRWLYNALKKDRDDSVQFGHVRNGIFRAPAHPSSQLHRSAPSEDAAALPSGAALARICPRITHVWIGGFDQAFDEKQSRRDRLAACVCLGPDFLPMDLQRLVLSFLAIPTEEADKTWVGKLQAMHREVVERRRVQEEANAASLRILSSKYANDDSHLHFDCQ